MGYSDFPFTIEQIALDLLNLKERHRGAVSFDVDCPFCGKRGKMNINTRKNTYRCNICDDGSKGSKSSGGMLDLYATAAPEAVTRAATPPSRAATLFSKTS